MNLGDATLLDARYVLVPADVPDQFVMDLDVATLPAGWSESPSPPGVQAIGDAWLASGASAALRVPSAIIEGHNLLLNPAHPDFARVRPLEARPLRVDPRLAGRR